MQVRHSRMHGQTDSACVSPVIKPIMASEEVATKVVAEPTAEGAHLTAAGKRATADASAKETKEVARPAPASPPRGIERARMIVARCLNPTDDTVSEWSKDDVCDLFHFLKQALSILMGLSLGLLGITGWRGFALYGAAVAGSSFAVVQHAHIPDFILTEMQAVQEAAMPSLMTFVVSGNRFRVEGLGFRV